MGNIQTLSVKQASGNFVVNNHDLICYNLLGYGGSSLFFGGFTGICEFIVGDWVSSD